jgi:hypothetical protein
VFELEGTVGGLEWERAGTGRELPLLLRLLLLLVVPCDRILGLGSLEDAPPVVDPETDSESVATDSATVVARETTDSVSEKMSEAAALGVSEVSGEEAYKRMRDSDWM